MKLPAQVQEAADLAEKLHAQMFPQQDDDEKQEQDQTEETQDEGVDQDEEDSQKEDSDTDTSDEYDVPHDDDLEELRKFKARYLTLKGMYDAEVPRLHKELKELKASVFEKFNQAFEEKAKQEQTKQESSQEQDELAKFEEEYGSEFVQQLRKLIAKEATQYVKPVQEQLESVEDTQIRAARTSFESYLDDKVGKQWRKAWYGSDPKFIEFLQQPDPSGLYTYGELAELYNNNWDADRLAKVFNTYFKTQQPQVPTEPQQKPKPKPQQEAMIAPSRTSNQPAPTADDKIIWTKEKMDEFQRLDRQGKYGKEESARLWNDLLSALAENRIR